MSEKNDTILVTGSVKRLYLSSRIMVNVARLAIKHYKNPLTAAKLLVCLNRRKEIIQGIRGLPRMYKAGGRYFYDVHQPGWPSPAFNRFFENEMLKTRSHAEDGKRLQNVVFAITNRCGLQCRHCFEWDNLEGNEKLSYANLQNILERVQQAGVSVVQVSGGEPLERFEDALGLVRNARPGTDFWMLTSGMGLDDNKAKQLREAGYTGINLSLDHWDEEKHNDFRGHAQSYEWALLAARNSREAGLMVALSLCATRAFVSRENLDKYLSLAISMGASFIQVLEPRAVGRLSGQSVKLSQDQRKTISTFYREVNHHRRYRRSPIIIYHGDYLRSHGCLGAASRYIYIDSTGRVHACPFCQDNCGHVLLEPLDILLERIESRRCHLFRKYSEQQ